MAGVEALNSDLVEVGPGQYELPDWLSDPEVEISGEYLAFCEQNRARKNLVSCLIFLVREVLGKAEYQQAQEEPNKPST